MTHRNESATPTPDESGLSAIEAYERRESPAAEGPRRMRTLELGKIFLQIGATAFGGLGPSLAIIERELVEKRRVLTAEDVAEAWAATWLLPGSTLIQVVSFLGYRLGGWGGSALATVACILPPVTSMFLLAIFYDTVSALPAFGPTTQGLAAAVVGLLLAATIRIGRATLGDRVSLGIAVVAFGSAAGLGVPAAVVVVVAGLIGIGLLSVSKTEQARGSGKGSGR
jgi:chromate transporter